MFSQKTKVKQVKPLSYGFLPSKSTKSNDFQLNFFGFGGLKSPDDLFECELLDIMIFMDKSLRIHGLKSQLPLQNHYRLFRTASTPSKSIDSIKMDFRLDLSPDTMVQTPKKGFNSLTTALFALFLSGGCLTLMWTQSLSNLTESSLEDG